MNAAEITRVSQANYRALVVRARFERARDEEISVQEAERRAAADAVAELRRSWR